MTPQTLDQVRAALSIAALNLEQAYYPDSAQKCTEALAALDAEKGAESFQSRVKPWMLACFGEEIANDTQERNHRFVEESLELAQSCGCSASEAHQLVDYVFGRSVGEKDQESGGVSVTHAALCAAQGIDMHEAAERELARIWTNVDVIRAKQAAKPKHSPLPIYASPPQAAPSVADVERLTWLEDIVACGVVTMGFEIDGGVFLDIAEMGRPEKSLREQNTIREAIDKAMKGEAPDKFADGNDLQTL